MFIDVGAQLGYYGFIAASLGARCIAVEANKNVFTALCKGINTNLFNNKVIAINAFCGIESYPTSICLDQISFGSRVVMEVDIEGFEPRALSPIFNLFENYYIKH